MLVRMILGLLLAAGAVSQAQQVRLSYFPLETGNSWTYHVVKNPGLHNELQFDTTITVGQQVPAPNGKRYFETGFGLLRVDSTTGNVWRYFPHVPILLTDSTQHCADSTELGFTFLAADSGDTYMMCDFGWQWYLQSTGMPMQVGALNISRRQMLWSSWMQARTFADSIGMSGQNYAGLGIDYYIWELTSATVYGQTYYPVQLQVFTAEKRASSVLLRWETAQETDNMGFEVRRCTDNAQTSWEAIGFVPSVTGRSAAAYRFEDNRLPSANAPTQLQYRLRQIDFSGRVWFSPVQTVNLNAPLSANIQLDISPMPVRSIATLKISGEDAEAWECSVYDTHGRRLALITLGQSSRTASAGKIILRGHSAGVYFAVAERRSSRVVRPFLYLP